MKALQLMFLKNRYLFNPDFGIVCFVEWQYTKEIDVFVNKT